MTILRFLIERLLKYTEIFIFPLRPPSALYKFKLQGKQKRMESAHYCVCVCVRALLLCEIQALKNFSSNFKSDYMKYIDDRHLDKSRFHAYDDAMIGVNKIIAKLKMPHQAQIRRNCIFSYNFAIARHKHTHILHI